MIAEEFMDKHVIHLPLLMRSFTNTIQRQVYMSRVVRYFAGRLGIPCCR